MPLEAHRRRLRAAADASSTSTTRSRRARRSCGRRRPATSRARRGTATREAATLAIRGGRARRDARSRQPAARAVRRSSRARRSRATTRATGRITLRVSCQTPTGLRDELCNEVLGIAPRQGARRRRRRRRRLRHEDDALCRGRRRRVLRARAEASGQMDAPSASRNSCRRRMAAISRARPSSRSTRTAAILALRVHSRANLGAYATPAGVVIQLLIGPWVSTSIYDIQTIDVHIKGVLTQHDADRPVPRRRPARGDLHHRAADGRGRAANGHRSASSSAAAT